MYENSYGIPFGDKVKNMVHEARFSMQDGCDLIALLSIYDNIVKIDKKIAEKIDLMGLIRKAKDEVEKDAMKELMNKVEEWLSGNYDKGFTARMDFYDRWAGMIFVKDKLEDKWGDPNTAQHYLKKYYDATLRSKIIEEA